MSGQFATTRDKRERSFIMIKPDGVQRGLIHKVVLKLEQRGFQMIAMKLTQADRATTEKHYSEHKGKPFFDGLVKFTMSGPVCAMIWEGDDVVATCRKLIGATNPNEAAPGTFRGDLAIKGCASSNIVHGSDSDGSAAREIGIWFKQEEIV